ncbi:hypothetical protein L0F63_006405 [Massospora cicadina]|nr:hypothetical protein L0F63_006405 [Massospora cicadina]
METESRDLQNRNLYREWCLAWWLGISPPQPQSYDYVVFKLNDPFCYGELEGAYVENDEA